MTSQLGTVSHMPPELLKLEDKRLSKKADVYSIGILIYEAVKGDIPFRGMALPQIILYIANGHRLRLDEDAEQFLAEIFDVCTAPEPHNRPSTDELLQLLQAE